MVYFHSEVPSYSMKYPCNFMVRLLWLELFLVKSPPQVWFDFLLGVGSFNLFCLYARDSFELWANQLTAHIRDTDLIISAASFQPPLQLEFDIIFKNMKHIDWKKSDTWLKLLLWLMAGKVQVLTVLVLSQLLLAGLLYFYLCAPSRAWSILWEPFYVVWNCRALKVVCKHDKNISSSPRTTPFHSTETLCNYRDHLGYSVSKSCILIWDPLVNILIWSEIDDMSASRGRRCQGLTTLRAL